MTPDDIHKAKDRDLFHSIAAIKRAALLARQVAIQTNTSIIVMVDGEIVSYSADELRQQEQLKQAQADIPIASK
jgi:hypothetical protein